MEDIDYRSPIYLQLREVIRTKVEEDEYLPGTAIPSENDLAEMYGVNRLTVRSAIDALVNEGMLKRVHGKGVYVVGEKIERDLETLGGFRQTMREKNTVPSTRIVTRNIRRAGMKYGGIFRLDPEEKLFYIKRVCCVEDDPVSLEEIYVPCSLLPELGDVDLTIFSLYDIYDFYGVKLTRAHQTLDLVTLDAKDARMLGIGPKQAVMLFECVSTDADGRTVEFARTYTRGDKCSFRVNFHMEQGGNALENKGDNHATNPDSGDHPPLE